MSIDTANSGYAQASSNALPLSPVQASPRSPTGNAPRQPLHARTGSENYYEDVDPRFAHDVQPPTETGEPDLDQHTALPSSLMPGQSNYRHPSPMSRLHPNFSNNNAGGAPTGMGMTMGEPSTSTSTLERDNSLENIAEGARSPAGSENSHFTSVSQRGINPNWRPPMGQGPMGGMGGMGSTASAQQRRREDVVLAANPDFSLPGMNVGGAGRGGRGGFRGGRGGGVPRGGAGGLAGAGLTPVGRYPTEGMM